MGEMGLNKRHTSVHRQIFVSVRPPCDVFGPPSEQHINLASVTLACLRGLFSEGKERKLKEVWNHQHGSVARRSVRIRTSEWTRLGNARQSLRSGQVWDVIKEGRTIGDSERMGYEHEQRGTAFMRDVRITI